MKNSILVTLLCLGIFPGFSQKIIEKHITSSAASFISMNFQISDSIRIITWKKQEVYVRSSINVNDNKNNENYQMTFNESGHGINVTGKLEFEKGKGCCGNDHNCCCCCHSEIFHEVYIPEGADFSVETINGNIIITGQTAEIRARSISGYIDLALAPERKADLKMNTISGTMYSNFDLPATAKKIRQVGGGNLSTQLNGGSGKSIDLQTISGNIYLRKEG